jgi:hypothetical protein
MGASSESTGVRYIPVLRAAFAVSGRRPRATERCEEDRRPGQGARGEWSVLKFNRSVYFIHGHTYGRDIFALWSASN